MTEFIDRNTAVGILEAMGNNAGCRFIEKRIRVAAKRIGRIPAADVAPVVRCKDCKWFADNNDGDWFGCWLFQAIQIIPEDAPKPDDFCSYGEPKMNGGDNGDAD